MKLKTSIQLIALLCGLLISSVVYSKKKNPKPNVIIILADDLGYEDLGYQGSKRVKTPFIDRLAEQGMRFTDGHVSASVCSPSRAGLMTGRYQQRFGHEGNCPPDPHGTDVNEKMIGQAMQEQGYKTACFGKWHLGNMEEHYPTNRGFDEFWGLREGSRSYWYNENKNDSPGSHKGIEHNGKQVKFDGHLTDKIGDQTVRFIESNKKNPFFIYLSFTAPHGPLESKPEDMEAIGTDDNYLGLIYGMDRNIGKVINTLEKNKLLENTIIWFLSDNGGIGPTYSNYPLGGLKGFKFEGGHRVPFILYWKDHVPAGQTYDEMVISLDIYATSVAAAGGSLEQPLPLDGVNILPYINGEKAGVPHEQLYWRKLDCAAMRDGFWKLIRVDNYGFALYNLENDIAETKDLSHAMPEKVVELTHKLEKWEEDKVDPLWQEGDAVKYMRLMYHKECIRIGKNPGNSYLKKVKDDFNKNNPKKKKKK
ncbi:hypothetical protein E9993_11740 [Labilibacter sediminis]|nr:hypothetical protein E9993_11740 [Labilibacter sediminis]